MSTEGGTQRRKHCDCLMLAANSIGASLTVMPGGEHWFHTDKQMRFLGEWITEPRREGK